jgi:hypothetical protein
MLASLSSKVNVTSRTTITTKLIELQLQIQEAIKLLVMGLFVACTTDAWTSVANITYCSLTLHFITSNWQLVCLSLDCCSFPGSNTGERVAAKLNELLASYGIAKDHVMACVTDTASNMKKSARFMEYDWWAAWLISWSWLLAWLLRGLVSKKPCSKLEFWWAA